MPRPDQSFYLAHFTKNGPQCDLPRENKKPTIEQMTALERLVNILENKKICASKISWVKKDAVCFTECPWGSLLRHVEKYSPYGIGFTKKLLYSRNANPVFYVNPNIFKSQKWEDDVYAFLTPFVPWYASENVKNLEPFNGKPIDYTHEREWRVTKDFLFTYKNVMFVVLKSVRDLEKIPENIVKEIGIEKFIFVDTYKKIEELWPTHRMD